MPNYTFRNNETNETFDISMSISERDQYVLNNPHLTQLITGAPAIGDSVRLGVRKPDDNFRDVLREIKSHHPGQKIGKIKNTINDF